MKLINIQVALFFDKYLERPDLFANRVNSRMNNMFDAMPQIVPLPEGAPAEIPTVQMSSTKQDNHFNVSKSRCDLILSPELLSQTSINAAATNLQELVHSYFKSVLDENIGIIRVGVISTTFDENEDAVHSIVDKYFVSKVKMKEASLRVNICDNVDGIELNNVLEISDGNLANENLGINQSGIVIRRDINNVPQEGQLLANKNLKAIWKKALSYCTDKKVGEIR